jgi:hypothetical protein
MIGAFYQTPTKITSNVSSKKLPHRNLLQNPQVFTVVFSFLWPSGLRKRLKELTK